MKQLLTKGANALKTGQSKSEGWSLDGEDAWKILVSCLIVGGGAALTAFEQQMSEQDFGMWTTAVMAVNTVLVNLARKFLADNSND